jgi:cell wall-associated NlpC family hydrolase
MLQCKLFKTYFYEKRQACRLFVALPFLLILLVAATDASEPVPKVADLSVEMAVDSLLCVAHRLQGIPYRYAGKNENGFDCSGYTRYVYAQLGFDLHASAATQFQQGEEVPADSLQQGDLLFFRNSQGRIFHVGLYVGTEQDRKAFIHASSSRGIVKDYLDQGYFHKRWAGARRIIP